MKWFIWINFYLEICLFYLFEVRVNNVKSLECYLMFLGIRVYLFVDKLVFFFGYIILIKIVFLNEYKMVYLYNLE